MAKKDWNSEWASGLNGDMFGGRDHPLAYAQGRREREKLNRTSTYVPNYPVAPAFPEPYLPNPKPASRSSGGGQLWMQGLQDRVNEAPVWFKVMFVLLGALIGYSTGLSHGEPSTQFGWAVIGAMGGYVFPPLAVLVFRIGLLIGLVGGVVYAIYLIGK